ncbi:MAG TPA: Gfo/Idh/MocA family oxidoreductase [Tepidisphaeraceae bacterium]|nr:Gfo/Idh/MocA family oxidoreductase [Tepidisphaeraceae bacterium]
MAVVGCGGMGGQHIGSIAAHPDATVAALVDVRPAAAQQKLKDLLHDDPSVRQYESLDAMLSDPPPGLRGVVIATPHTLHFAQSVACLQRGLDVLVEKPMVTSSAHARELKSTIERTGRQFQVAFQAPFSREFAYIRQQLQSGALGELQTITAFSCQGWRKACANTWRHDPKLSGGGQMYDTGAHLFNSIAWLVDRPVVEVFCITDNKGLAVDINAAMTIRWEGNVLGSVTISGNTPGWQEGIWISGDRGRIATGIHGGRLEQFDEKGPVKYPLVTQPHQTPVGNFIDCLLGKAQPCCPVRYGILHSWLMDALYESAREGRAVKPSAPPL